MKQVDAISGPDADHVAIAGGLAAMRDADLTHVGVRLSEMTEALQSMTVSWST